MGIIDTENLRLFCLIFHAEISLGLFPDGVKATNGLRVASGVSI